MKQASVFRLNCKPGCKKPERFRLPSGPLFSKALPVA
jgi:hypothetical protein